MYYPQRIKSFSCTFVSLTDVSYSLQSSGINLYQYFQFFWINLSEPILYMKLNVSQLFVTSLEFSGRQTWNEQEDAAYAAYAEIADLRQCGRCWRCLTVDTYNGARTCHLLTEAVFFYLQPGLLRVGKCQIMPSRSI